MNKYISIVTCFIWICCYARADDIEKAPVEYSKTQPANTIVDLKKRLAQGHARLVYREEDGYLRSLLKELDIPLSSQVLVFSKTSLQRGKISPKTPRAIYFNDDVYLGYCLRGHVIEISVADTRLGTVFYTLEQEHQQKPELPRQTENCMICHASSYNHGFPGHLVRSVFPDRHGEPLLALGSYRTDQTSRFEDRWGGWYVTGTHGPQKHLGNQSYTKTGDSTDPSLATQNVTDLSQHFTVGLYPSPHSDLVALMVLEHQAMMHNRFTRALLETKQALYYQEELNKAFNEKPGTLFDSTQRRLEGLAENLVKYMLMSQEARLSHPISGTSGFSGEFAQRGPQDKKGRSLRDFDLKTRLFKYPCSYLIYSKSFDALPPIVLEKTYAKLLQVLNGKDSSKAYEHLTAADKTAIKEILLDTKPNLPASWKTDVVQR
ncbi:MAG TPA: hypothetical protein PKA06_10335 [Gemmatales bacterium]|nr:hypothetical protein [Gemmatales bacterium]